MPVPLRSVHSPGAAAESMGAESRAMTLSENYAEFLRQMAADDDPTDWLHSTNFARLK